MKNKTSIDVSKALHQFPLKYLGYFLSIALSLMFLKSEAQTFPAGFSQVKIPNIYYPTSMAFAPDGRIFVTEKAGKIRIIKNGVVSNTFATVTVDQLNERGLGSICLDPNFSSNHYVYVYYTSTSGSIHNRLSRFTADGDYAVAGSEVIIMEFEPSVGSLHNGGGMCFAPDGKLFLAVGNDNVNANSQNLDTYKGKVLRINPDGSVPSGNPFSGSEAAKRIWAYGFRNPWTIDIQPGTGKLFVNDVGEGAWEEINDATSPGKNFGWPDTEGPTSNPAYTSPLYAYRHSDPDTEGGCAVSGGAFFNPGSTNYPSQYAGKYFFLDYCNNWINYLDLSSGVTKHNFASGLDGALNCLKTGKDGNIYYFSISENSLYKIVYSGSDSPVITQQPANLTIAQGQNAAFNVTASGANPLYYQWLKNGNTISGANSANYTINNVQAGDAGQYSVKVSNSFGNITSNSATLTVTAFNSKPNATILSPVSGTLYRYSDIINFSGSATDNEDGNLPASSLYWYIECHHDLHIHPGPTVPAGVSSGSFTADFGDKSANVYYRLCLVATDAGGLKDTTFVDIPPHKSQLTIATQPAGLQILVDEQPEVAPYSVPAVVGMPRNINVITPQKINGANYIFDHWSQGGTAAQSISITDSDASYTAFYNLQIGIDEKAANPYLIKVFPNPTDQSIITIGILGYENGTKPVRLNVFDITGKLLYSDDKFCLHECQETKLDLDGHYSPGTYLFDVVIEDNVYHQKLTIQ
jgi:glucose/arabinose dehydrogenase